MNTKQYKYRWCVLFRLALHRLLLVKGLATYLSLNCSRTSPKFKCLHWRWKTNTRFSYLRSWMKQRCLTQRKREVGFKCRTWEPPIHVCLPCGKLRTYLLSMDDFFVTPICHRWRFVETDKIKRCLNFVLTCFWLPNFLTTLKLDCALEVVLCE